MSFARVTLSRVGLGQPELNPTGLIWLDAALEGPAPTQVATPVASPPGGDFSVPTLVVITSATEDADFYYTLDGSDPDAGDTHYTVPFLISSTAELRIIAIKAGQDDSDIRSYTFVISASVGPEIISVIALPDFVQLDEETDITIEATTDQGETITDYDVIDEDASGAIIVQDGVDPNVFHVTFPS